LFRCNEELDKELLEAKICEEEVIEVIA
jgi:hypothetical protein